MRKIAAVLASGAVGATVLAGWGAAAATRTPELPTVCVSRASHALTAPLKKGRCPKGAVLTKVGQAAVPGATGPAGPPGPKGDTGPAGPVRSYLANWRNGALANASPGVTLVTSSSAGNGAWNVRLRFPVAVSTCAVQATVSNANGYHVPASGTPDAQAGTLPTNDVFVTTVWTNGTNIDFSLLVLCPG